MDDSIKTILNILCPLNPHDVFLFGSRARNNARETSDYDIMIFWKKSNFPHNKYESYDDYSNRMFNLSNMLSDKLNAPVDLVVMKYMNKWVNNDSVHDNTFYECVKANIYHY